MKLKHYKKLTWSLVESYGGRKEAGVISLIFDAHTHKFYAVPRETEHVVFVAEKILNISVDEFRQSPQLAERLIPVNIFMEGEMVVAFLIGVSGMELGLSVRHRAKDLRAAQRHTRKFIMDGEVWHSEKLDERVSYSFTK